MYSKNWGVVHICAAAVFLGAVLDAVLDTVVVDDDLGGIPDDACGAFGVAEFSANHHPHRRADAPVVPWAEAEVGGAVVVVEEQDEAPVSEFDERLGGVGDFQPL